MNKPIRHTAGRAVPGNGHATVTRSDGSTYELPTYAEYREAVREQYKTDPGLERLATRFAFEWQRDEIAYLRSVGMDDLADMYATDLDGAFMPTARWLRERLPALRKPRDLKYRQEHREERHDIDAKWREDHRSEFDALRLSRPFVVIDSEGQDYDGDDIIVPTAQGDVLYKKHGTYVWCASTDDPDKPTYILADPGSKGKDKRHLEVKTILDWLLSLPHKYNPVTINRREQKGAIFIMFGSGYDITQLLAKTSLKSLSRKVACR